MTIEKQIAELLTISDIKANLIAIEANIYSQKLTTRFLNINFRNRLRRTNPFLLQACGITTIKEWADFQVDSTLRASSEEALGHFLEAIVKILHPRSVEPEFPDDLDMEIIDGNDREGCQIKMSFDCLSNSMRKNLSHTITKLTEYYRKIGIAFTGLFCPLYGATKTTKQPAQSYTILRSRDFWDEIGAQTCFDESIGQLCKLLCIEATKQLHTQLIPSLKDNLQKEGSKFFGNSDGTINYHKLFRLVNA